MLAGYHFTRLIKSDVLQVVRIKVDLYGSLSLTGVSYHTDLATILGLLGINLTLLILSLPIN